MNSKLFMEMYIIIYNDIQVDPLKKMKARNWKNILNFNTNTRNKIKTHIFMSYLQNTNAKLASDDTWLIRRIRSQNASKNYISKHKTFCFISGRTKSTYRFTNLSRYQIKILLTKGLLTGLKPSSW